VAKAPRTLARRRRALPEGGQVRALARPSASKNARTVATAARWIYDGRRLDMQGLADELGVSRVTLFRRVGSREDLLGRDVAEFGLVTLIEPGALAYALVRLGESFLYADVIAARKPDVATANRLQQALIEGILP
jgi:hypothetical protein